MEKNSPIKAKKSSITRIFWTTPEFSYYILSQKINELLKNFKYIIESEWNVYGYEHIDSDNIIGAWKHKLNNTFVFLYRDLRFKKDNEIDKYILLADGISADIDNLLESIEIINTDAGKKLEKYEIRNKSVNRIKKIKEDRPNSKTLTLSITFLLVFSSLFYSLILNPNLLGLGKELAFYINMVIYIFLSVIILSMIFVVLIYLKYYIKYLYYLSRSI